MAAEQRAARARLLSAASSGRIRKGMIRYVQLVRFRFCFFWLLIVVIGLRLDAA